MKITHRVFISWMLLFFAFSTVLVYSIALGPVSSEATMLSSAASDSYFSQLIAAIFSR